MSSVTPFFSITASSSLRTSSNVKPYWKPEQPPPVTKTRSFSSGLPSSSIRLLTLFAALSLKTSGIGIGISAAGSGVTLSVTAFIHMLLMRDSFLLSTRSELELDALCFGAVVDEAPFNHCALMDFQALVVDGSFGPGAGLEF